MGVLDKVMFWKKKDDLSDLGIDTSPGKDPFGASPGAGDPFSKTGIDPAQDRTGMNAMSSGLDTNPPTGLDMQTQNPYPQASPMNQGMNDPMQPRFQSPQQPAPSYTPQQEIENKNMEIISSKLDALRVSIESINQRLSNLEHAARGEEPQQRRRLY